MKNKKTYNLSLLTVALIALSLFMLNINNEANAARIKDVATVEGAAETQLIGYGLVVGLNQTGDNQLNAYTNQSVLNMLKRFGITTDGRMARNRNVAAVMVTATVPGYLKRGSKVDVVVSSMGDATSLQGGTLLLTSLATADGYIVGNAQGPISVGGYDFSSLGSRVGRNFVTSGRVPDGLILTEEISTQVVQNSQIRITLRNPDYSTVTSMVAAINTQPGLLNNVQAIDAATVVVNLPAGGNQNQIMRLIADIEQLNINVDPAARVVINERTGTIVVGGTVELLPVVVAHGGLEIAIQRQLIVPQPAPFTIMPPRMGETAEVEVKEEINPAQGIEIAQPTTVAEMAGALNLLQLKPRDLIAIFQALKTSGSLQAELIIQ